jgi:hypothetical protein
MISTKASAVSGPTPGCAINRCASGTFLRFLVFGYLCYPSLKDENQLMQDSLETPRNSRKAIPNEA